jgi:ATP-dependent Clp protease protease subunit
MNQLLKLLASNKANALRRFEIVAKDDSAEVFLYDAIVSDEAEAEWYGGIAAAPFVKALRGINAKTINLRINSPGGSVFAARAIEQALRDHPAKVIAHVDGLAASAATFIAMAADEVVMAKGALFMVHKAWGMAMGNSTDMMETAALLEKIDGTLVDTYAERTGQKPEQIAEWLAAETWFTADEAVQYGFADRVADAKAKNTWDLSAYDKAPAPSEPEGSSMSTANANRLRLMLA